MYIRPVITAIKNQDFDKADYLMTHVLAITKYPSAKYHAAMLLKNDFKKAKEHCDQQFYQKLYTKTCELASTLAEGQPKASA